jgi:hypothetical protein
MFGFIAGVPCRIKNLFSKFKKFFSKPQYWCASFGFRLVWLVPNSSTSFWHFHSVHLYIRKLRSHDQPFLAMPKGLDNKLNRALKTKKTTGGQA